MKLLLDAAIPAPRVPLSRHGNLVQRWSEADVTDSELLKVAGTRGYGAVIFLGPQVLARPGLKDAAKTARIAVVATATEVPTDSLRHVENHVDSIAAKSSPGGLLLLRADGVKRIAWPRVQPMSRSR